MCKGCGKVPIDLNQGNVDLCTISAHKFHGLKGTGILYIREGVNLSRLLSGGNQEGKRRSGTENVAGAVEYGKSTSINHEKTMKDKK